VAGTPNGSRRAPVSGLLDGFIESERKTQRLRGKDFKRRPAPHSHVPLRYTVYRAGTKHQLWALS
jgi:hypothetical protein